MVLRKATVADAGTLVALICELAEYERLTHEVAASESRLAAHLAPDANPRCEAVIAETEEGEPAGFALFFSNYSTFLTNWGIYLEDLFVREAYRGAGIGHALLSWLASEAVHRGASRLEWQVLDWNQSAIDFYENLGARALQEWQPMRLEGPALTEFAATADGALSRINAHGRARP